MNARAVSASTLQFLLTDTASIEVNTLHLTLVSAFVADGQSKATLDILKFALQQQTPANDLRQALIFLASIVGPFRTQNALHLLHQAAKQLAKPSGGLGALMGDSGGDVDPAAVQDLDSGSSSADSAGLSRGTENFTRIFGDQSKSASEFFHRRSNKLGRWLISDHFGRARECTDLDDATMSLVSIGGLYAMALEHSLKLLVSAARAHFDDNQLWHVHDLLKRQFQDGPVISAGNKAFSAVLGSRSSESPDGQDPFRWD